MDAARSKAAEVDLNRHMEKRFSRESYRDARAETWKASVAAYNARKREENRLAWCDYHKGQAERHMATLEALVEHHVKQAEMYGPGPEGE